MCSFRNYQVVTIILLASITYANSCRHKSSVSFSKLATCEEFTTDSKNCNHYIPLENIRNHAGPDDKLLLKFYVMIINSANMILSKTKDEDFRFVIGSKSNTYSYIKYNGTILDDTNMRDITSPYWPTPIVIRQTNEGELTIGIPGVVDPILRSNAIPLTTNYVCFYTSGELSRWFYNCTDDED